MNNREIKYRAWDGKYKQWTGFKIDNIDCNNKIFFECSETKKSIIDDNFERFTLIQCTSLKDKDGSDFWNGDIVNIFYTSSNGEHNHDCIYKVTNSPLGGIEFEFVKLLWEYSGYNQHPISRILSARYDTLSMDTNEISYDRLQVSDTYYENHLKCNDKSSYFKIIGNIYENPELLEPEK